MNILFLIGIAVFLGTFGGKVFQRLKIPQVVGYIIVGILLGRSAFDIMSRPHTEMLHPLVNYTLGIIGFMIGSELKGEVFSKYGRSIYAILISEGVLAFVAVAAIVTIVTKELYLGLLLGAIASATDPASTVNVLWEYKAKGPLTTTLTSIVALDDGLALVLYALVSTFSKSMITKEHFSLLHSIMFPALEIFECLLLGFAAGLLLVHLLSRIKEEDLHLSFALGWVAVVVGISVQLHLDLILSSMALGATVINVMPKIKQKLLTAVKDTAAPLYILFFVIVGATLDIGIFLKASVLIVIVAYLIGRSAGKIFGAAFGAVISNAKKSVRRYTGICLFTQGGVAIGLAMSIAHNFSYLGAQAREAGTAIISVVAATTVVVQLLGPILVKFGITKADEVWRNITEDDIVEKYKVVDFMRSDYSVIKENYDLAAMMSVIKDSSSYHFAVEDSEGNLMGVISLGELRDTFMEEQMDHLVLARDVAVPPVKTAYKAQPLKEALEIFSRRELDYLVVMEGPDSKKVAGVLEYRPLVESIQRKLLERQQGAKSTKST